MIVCSCNIITRRAIEETIEQILAEDPYAVLTPGRIYHRLGRRAKCGGCIPQVVRIMVEHGEKVRARLQAEAEAERKVVVVERELEVVFLERF
ncbi:(2Fe-2S)-binding protein [Propylenella binzhouense]|uniref:(2Fe-2S)-binding protein n=1 Tax=Propylenella binzhouense TaxID=2555902 RepID=A0A964WV73_9HYPH|nr:(2Fe-2S)-binding protein [Propylenella binzhouense]MYZ49866.1 (2Fe-2S)-binding protein [Propylenella binzhouense]